MKNYRFIIILFIFLSTNLVYASSDTPKVTIRGVNDYQSEFNKNYNLALNGDVIAQNNLGVMYANGQGTPVNLALANEWFLKAAENGSSMAQFNIGQNYLYGTNGLPKNRNQAIQWLKKSAKNGHAQAKLVLAGLQ